MPSQSTVQKFLYWLSTIGIVAIAHEFGVKYAEQKGWYDNLPNRLEEIIKWFGHLAEPMWFKILVALITGATAGIWIHSRLRQSNNLISKISDPSEPISANHASRTLIRLRFSGHMESPEVTDHENIESWFVYWSPGGRIANVETAQSLLEIPSSWIIFLTFKSAVEYHQLATNFTGERPKMVQVRQALKRSAVVTIDGGMPACEMEIVTRALANPY
ncbi:MAG: hypothetical protein J0I67_04835 [Bosea sp.]|nr:hypothetical protein [Bosea sp. (in: a-proteobacteria)]